MTSTIKVWRYHRTGLLTETLQLDELPTPQPGAGQVLIKVANVAANPVDWKIPLIKPIGPFVKKPRVVGGDVAGVIEALGPGAESSALKKGDRVMGHVVAKQAIRTGEGTFAQRVVLPISMVQKIPDDLSFEKAAGIPLVGLTALGLASYASEGQRVLVCGGSTSVGLLLIKILKQVSKVSFLVATASGSKVDVVKQRGADDVVDYREHDSVAELTKRYKDAPFDVILDCVGDMKVQEGSAAYLKPSGTHYNVGASGFTPHGGIDFSFLFWQLRTSFLPTFLGGVPRKYQSVVLEGHRMPQLGEVVRSIDLDPLTDSTFSFDEAPKAYERLMSNRALGKIVVVVDPSLS